MKGGVHAFSEGAAGSRARDRGDASALGADPARRIVARAASAALPRDVRAHPEPLALQVLQRPVQRALRRSSPMDRLLALGEEPERLRAVN